MELIVTDKDNFKKYFPTGCYCYNESWFHELNKGKVEKIEYFIFKTKKVKFGIVAGFKDKNMRFPYSAPFTIFEKKSSDINLEDIDSALQLLDTYAKEHGIHSIWFRLPPSFYDETFISKMQNCMLRNGYFIEDMDLNYQFFLKDQKYIENVMRRNAKKNLRIALEQDYELIHCGTEEEKKKAYDIIAVNRLQKGYPLRMTWEQVKTTTEHLSHDFWILNLGNISIAAAVIFKVTADVYQVIYWGDVEGYSVQKPMNYLAYKLYLYYAEKGLRVLDIGPSTEDGFPNYGLCQFKESIGCDVSSKITFVKKTGE